MSPRTTPPQPPQTRDNNDQKTPLLRVPPPNTISDLSGMNGAATACMEQRQERAPDLISSIQSADGFRDERDDIASHQRDDSTDVGEPFWKNPVQKFYERTQSLWSQLTVPEISGSLGDLGTLIPLTVAMARQRSILLAPALFFAGLANVITGYSWDVPMCVQPMKSIAAVALSESLSRETVTASGILVGGLILVIGVTNFIEVVNVIVPTNVVSGIQIGIGLRLAGKGINGVQALSWVGEVDCILLALCLSVLCLYWLREGNANSAASNDSDPEQATPRSQNQNFILKKICFFLDPNPLRQHPIGIYLFLVGAFFATITLATTSNEDGKYDLPLRFFGAPVAVWAMDTVTRDDWRIGLLEGALPQLPLTTLNSVISVCCLAHSLYPEKRQRSLENTGRTDTVVTRREVSISVGMMNLAMCPFGGMPNCHGAGGLAAQHRLGARHGASVVFLGINKMMLAVFFGASALTLLDAFPVAVLGVMLAIAGQELATTGFTLLVSSVEEDHRNRRHRGRSKKVMLRKSAMISVITAMVIVALGKTHFGALSGWVAHMVYGDGLTDFVEWVRPKFGRLGGLGMGRRDMQLSTSLNNTPPGTEESLSNRCSTGSNEGEESEVTDKQSKL